MTPGTKTVLCGEAAAGKRSSQDTLCLRNSGTNRNVHLQIDDISRTLATNIPHQLIDLVEIATFVYVADQFFPRGGAGVDEMGANWRRSLHFEIPVRRLDLWRREDVATALRDTLSFLSEDEYHLTFRQYQKPPPLEGYLTFAEMELATKPDRVVLFSGGLDSLGGAVKDIVVDGRPIALVLHQPTTKLTGRHRTLRQMLDGRAKGPKPLHVTVRINKAENLTHEYTQRSRSFLYASLAAAIAQMCGQDAIRFYENGTVSLNLPISRQVVGAKATRTTHPRVLAGLKQLFSLLMDKPFEVDNGFLWNTKEQVVRSIVDAGCGGMIEWSTSCTHTWTFTSTKPHCGTCSQCIDRRFAILAAGAATFERADSYSVDLLTGARAEGEERTMLASYVEVAQQVATMNEMQFFMRFGEVARIVRYLGGAADQNARSIFDLHQRHARAVLGVIDQGLAQSASQIRARSLPEGCLLRMVHDPSVPDSSGSRAAGPVTEDAPSPDYLLQQRGEGWQLKFAGHEALWFKAAIGLRYLCELIRFPGKTFSVHELLVSAYGMKAALPLGDGGEALDGQARKAYAERLQEISEDLDEARDHNDLSRIAQCERDRDMIVQQMKDAGFKRQAKRTKSDLNNIRNSVCNAVRRSIDNIAKFEPAAADHFTKHISFGFSVTYQPPQPLPWRL